MSYIDSLGNLVLLTYDSSACHYTPYDRNWVKARLHTLLYDMGPQ